MPFSTSLMFSSKPWPMPRAIFAPISAKTVEGERMPKKPLIPLTISPTKPLILSLTQLIMEAIPSHRPKTMFLPTSTMEIAALPIPVIMAATIWGRLATK